MAVKSLRAVALAGLAAGLALAVVPAVASASPSRHVNSLDHVVGHTKSAQQSSNWSGYAETGSGFTNASATWTVPSVSASGSDTFSSAWVGIDGDGNSNLIQTGTESDYSGGQASYYAWWEILPAAETPIDSLSVSPGDSITASVAQASGSTWNISLTDNTTGRSFSTQQQYGGSGSSVEYIQEAPEINGQISQIADFSPFDFSGLTVNGGSPNLTADDEILLVQNGTTYSTPSGPNASGDGFSVSYTG
jgi:Peptidase A4 family